MHFVTQFRRSRVKKGRRDLLFLAAIYRENTPAAFLRLMEYFYCSSGGKYRNLSQHQQHMKKPQESSDSQSLGLALHWELKLNQGHSLI